MGQFYNVTINNVTTKTKTVIKMEAGVTFENKNYRYTMNNNGKLSIFDKNTQKTTEGKSINVTDYQQRTLNAVVNNNEELEDVDVLSVEDVQTAIDKGNDGTLGEDLGEFLQNGYNVNNPKAFVSENKFSAYISNGKDSQSSVLAFQYSKDYYDVSVKNVTTGETVVIKMEKGVSFENNGAIYRMNNDGLLSVYDKDRNKWVAGRNEINMTSYQLQTFKAVANNVNECPGEECSVISKDDIISAIDMYKNKKLSNDLGEFLKIAEYKATEVRAYSNNTAFSTYVTNGNDRTSASLVFKHGSAEDAVEISDYVNNEVRGNDVEIIENRGNNKKGSQTLGKLKPSSNCADLIKISEGYREVAYKCPAGVYTIGWGHTKGVKRRQKVSKVRAIKYLNDDMEDAAKCIRQNVKVKLTQNQFDALVSFVFNVGEGNFKKSTLLKCLNKGDFVGASAQFSRWVYADNKKQPGLITRRSRERALFDK